MAIPIFRSICHGMTKIQQVLYLGYNGMYVMLFWTHSSYTLVFLIVVPYASIFFGKFFSPYACSRAYACIVCENF